MEGNIHLCSFGCNNHAEFLISYTDKNSNKILKKNVCNEHCCFLEDCGNKITIEKDFSK